MNPRDKAQQLYEQVALSKRDGVHDPVHIIIMGLWEVRQKAIDECYKIALQELGFDHRCSRSIAYLKGEITF